MSLRRDPFGSALRHLRAQLTDGSLRPGQALVIQDLAADLKLSVTPIREVLARLAGEGRIEVREGGGYRVWPADAVDLADLYEAHLSALVSSLRIVADEPSRRTQIKTTTPHLTEGPGSGLPEQAFDDLVQACGNQVLIGWRRNLADRLAPARQVEGLVFPDWEAEAQALVMRLRTEINPADRAGR